MTLRDAAGPSAIRQLASGRRRYGNLKDEAAGFIREAIVSGGLPPRSKIDQDEIVALVSGMTTRRAVRKLTRPEIEELARLHREIATTEDAARRRSLDRRFFQIIATAGKSPRLDASLEFLGGVLQGSFYYDAPAWGDNEAKYREKLLDTIRAGDAVAATRTSEEHVRSCAAVTIEHLRTRGYLPPPPLP